MVLDTFDDLMIFVSISAKPCDIHHKHHKHHNRILYHPSPFSHRHHHRHRLIHTLLYHLRPTLENLC